MHGIRHSNYYISNICESQLQAPAPTRATSTIELTLLKITIEVIQDKQPQIRWHTYRVTSFADILSRTPFCNCAIGKEFHILEFLTLNSLRRRVWKEFGTDP